MAPPAYGSPYAYAYGSPYYYPPGNYYGDALHYYPSPSYAGYYSYHGGSGYDPAASSPVQPTGNPLTVGSYPGHFPGYNFAQPYWGLTGPAVTQPSGSPAAYPPVYSPWSPGILSSNMADDRSATPTPIRHGACVSEDTLETQ
jgi:hypothetical protein